MAVETPMTNRAKGTARARDASDAAGQSGSADVLRALRAVVRSLAPNAATDRLLRTRAATWARRLARRRRRPGIDVFGYGVESRHEADLEMVSKALAGDTAAVDGVRHRVQAVVLSRIHAMGLGWNEDELLPSIMDRIWDKLPSYRGQASLPTWAWTVACNYLRNWQRDIGSREVHSTALDADRTAAHALTAPPEDAPSYALEERERQARRRQLLARVAEVARQELRPDEWQLIQRVVVRGEDYATIAGEQSELPGTLRARVFRALNRIRVPLREELGEEAAEYFREG